MLAGAHGDDAELVRALNEQGIVRIVKSVVDALAALHTQRYDLVIAGRAELPALGRAVGQAGVETALERIGQGVCIVDGDGKLVWANPKLRSYPQDAVESVRAACEELCREFVHESPEPQTQGSRTRIVRAGAMHRFELTASALTGVGGQVDRVIALARDVSQEQRLQERLNLIDVAGRQLVEVDPLELAGMDAGERLQTLEDKVISYFRDLLQFDHFAVLVLDKETNRLDTVVSGGFPEEAKGLEIRAEETGNGISGWVAATGRSCICPNVSKDPRYLPGLREARSSLTVALYLHDQVVGVLNVESDQVAAFSQADRQFAEIFARYIAHALHILRLLAAERSTTTEQVGADVGAEIAAPLNEVTAAAAAALRDCGDDAQLRRRMETVLSGVETVRQAVLAVTEPHALRGLAPQAPARDPVLAGKRILVADDEDIIRETICDVLAKAGACTSSACDGEEAIKLIRADQFDLVLSDIKMPYRNGYEVFSAARESSPDCAVILITGFGYDPRHSIVRASKKGLDAVLFKPFKVEQLLNEVRQALSGVAH